MVTDIYDRKEIIHVCDNGITTPENSIVWWHFTYLSIKLPKYPTFPL